MENFSLTRKGLIGELKTQLMILNLGFNVFNNVCDDGGVDFIIEKDNIYKKIQVKRATSIKSKRLSFRLGNTNKKPDFVICLYEDDYWIVPIGAIKTNAFQIYPFGDSSYINENFKNRWDLL